MMGITATLANQGVAQTEAMILTGNSAFTTAHAVATSSTTLQPAPRFIITLCILPSCPANSSSPTTEPFTGSEPADGSSTQPFLRKYLPHFSTPSCTHFP